LNRFGDAAKATDLFFRGRTVRLLSRQASGERKDFVGKLQEEFYNFTLRFGALLVEIEPV
jgi:hypothetical protein